MQFSPRLNITKMAVGTPPFPNTCDWSSGRGVLKQVRDVEEVFLQLVASHAKTASPDGPHANPRSKSIGRVQLLLPGKKIAGNLHLPHTQQATRITASNVLLTLFSRSHARSLLESLSDPNMVVAAVQQAPPSCVVLHQHQHALPRP